LHRGLRATASRVGMVPLPHHAASPRRLQHGRGCYTRGGEPQGRGVRLPEALRGRRRHRAGGDRGQSREDHCCAGGAARRADDDRPPARETVRAAMPERPFEMAVLGDSVLWGSGLEEEQKLWSMVRRWLEEHGETVRVRVLAHSLAVVEPDPVKDAPPPLWGEIRYRYPSITYQALKDPRLGDDPAAISLVLVDGGINDLGPLNLVNPWRSSRWVREQAAEHCGRKMRNLLLSLLTRVPEAQVVVTGYFPIVSAQTWFVRALPFPSVRRRLVELSETWAEASETWLRWAVDQANL